MGMEVHSRPADWHTLTGKGICELRLWDTDTNWIDLETSEGVYDWTTLDNLLSVADKQGFEVLYTFGHVPKWATSNPDDPNCRDKKYGHGDCAPPKDVDQGDALFKGFVTALIQHVGTRITYFEMWNEPYNLPYWDGTPEQLAIMVSDAAQIIRQANPQAVILTPSVSPWSNQHVFVRNFLNACQGKVSFDVFAMHGYTYGGPPEKILTLLDHVQKFKLSIGLQNMPLWSTEGSDKDWVHFSQEQKLEFVARYYSLELNSGVLRHYWYSWDDRNIGGLMGTPGSTVYATVASWFTGRTPLGCARTGHEYVCTLRDNDNHQIVWVTTGTANFKTKKRLYQTFEGVIHPVVDGTVPITTAPVFIGLH
jgi:hypothetical protein